MASRTPWRRKVAVGLWISTMSALIILLFLILWSHFYKPEIFEPIRLAGSIAIPVSFVLLLLMLALNRWKGLLKNPYK